MTKKSVSLSGKETMLLKLLLKKELEQFNSERSQIEPTIALLELEEEYNIFLENLLAKLE